MASHSYGTEGKLHVMVTPESIDKANKLAALNHLSLDELFAQLLLAEWDRSKRREKTTSKASP